MSDCEGVENTTAASQTVDIKASWYQEIYSSNNRTNDRGNFELRNVPKITTQSNNNNNNNPIATKDENKNITLSQRSTSCCDVNQKAINIKKSILAKSYYCSMSSQEFEFSMANSLAEMVHQHHADDMPRPSRARTKMTPMEPMREEEKGYDNCNATGDGGIKPIVVSRKVEKHAEFNLAMIHQKIFLFGGIDPYTQRHTMDGYGTDVLYYDSCDNVWKYLSNMPGSRHHHSAAVYRGKVYVIGGTRPALLGSNKSIFETAVWSFDPKRLEWNNECTLPQPRRDFGLIAFDNDATNNNEIPDAGQGNGKRLTKAGLYIIGGESTEGTPLSSTLYYNVEGKFWSEKASLNIGRYGLVAAVVNIKNTAEIWIAGGVCGKEKGGMPIITDTMEYYNLSSDDGSWKQSVKRLRVPRLFARFCTTCGGKDLYIIGGIGLDIQTPGEFSSLSSVDRYDFQQDQWTHVADMMKSRHGHDVVSVKDNILIFGGVSTGEKKTLKSVECYCTKTGKWLFDMAFLPSALSGLAAVVMDCEI